MKNKNIIGIAGTILAIGVVALAAFLFFQWKGQEDVVSKSENAYAGDISSSSKKTNSDEIVVGGNTYVYNSNMRNILFMGVDKKEEMTSNEYAGNGGQADCIMLLCLNTEDMTGTLLNISRDSMTDIDIYDISGDFVTTEKQQLALQYAYGDGEARSCWLMKKAVSELLSDIPIHGYMSLNLDGFSAINDVLGGVELTIPEDYTFIDPDFQKGVTLRLTGSQAERYVRYRNIEEFGSNNGRMERQNQYIRALVGVLKEKVSSDSAFVDILYKAGQPYMTTDLTVDQMKELSQYSLDESYVKVPGETVAGEHHDEYVVDEEKLSRLLVDILYTQENKK